MIPASRKSKKAKPSPRRMSLRKSTAKQKPAATRARVLNVIQQVRVYRAHHCAEVRIETRTTHRHNTRATINNCNMYSISQHTKMSCEHYVFFHIRPLPERKKAFSPGPSSFAWRFFRALLRQHPGSKAGLHFPFLTACESQQVSKRTKTCTGDRQSDDGGYAFVLFV